MDSDGPTDDQTCFPRRPALGIGWVDGYSDNELLHHTESTLIIITKKKIGNGCPRPS
jgi:hypothetical protein